jgi:hypothetical protein
MLLEQIRTVFTSGGLSGAKIVAGGRRFHVVVDTKAGGQVVLVRHLDSRPRFFSDPGTAIKLLHDIGFRMITVDMSGWNAGQAELSGC